MPIQPNGYQTQNQEVGTQQIPNDQNAQVQGDPNMQLDANGNPIDPNMQYDEYGNPIDGAEGQMPEDEMGYMQNSIDQIPTTPESNSNENSANSQKVLHLFDLSQKLFEYTKLLEKSLENIDNEFIETDTIVKLSQLNDTLKRYKDKLRDFIAEVFYKETYEKNLYSYLTFRYELLSIIKYLRALLKLDVLDPSEEVNKNENKK